MAYIACSPSFSPSLSDFLLDLFFSCSRRWFERAAAQNDPEGLYNVGIFHNNGQAGLPQNPGVALEYFHRAADHPNPFPMALHAVGELVYVCVYMCVLLYCMCSDEKTFLCRAHSGPILA